MHSAMAFFARVRQTFLLPPVLGQVEQDVHVSRFETEGLLPIEDDRRYHRPTGVHQRLGPLTLVYLELPLVLLLSSASHDRLLPVEFLWFLAPHF
jgi:hypothetical protein